MSVKVAVRVRPFNSREKKLNCTCVVDMKDPVTILKAYQGQQDRNFTFDYSFWSFDQFTETQPDGYLSPSGTKYADQKSVFNKIGTNILNNAWEGYHCCLFAYGQTGSGKSYSMIGFGSNKGIVPITCNQIFQRIKKKNPGEQFQVNCSMMEIYNEQIQDLTIPISQRVAQGLKIRENKVLGIYVEGMKKHLVNSFSEIQSIMEQGTKNRTVAATQMNATSSRAHTIITIQFKQIKNKMEKLSVINLVDLAGSERQDKTAATGQRLKEAVGINQSLTSLGQVISKLAENSEGKNNHIPYRDSALTRILQNALGGNSQTIMICAISPASDNYDQTLSTLRYADRAKKIKNKPIVNQSQTDKLIKELKAENQRLRKLLQGKGTDPNKPIEKQQKKQQKSQIKKQETNKQEKKEDTSKKQIHQDIKKQEKKQNIDTHPQQDNQKKQQKNQKQQLESDESQSDQQEEAIRASLNKLNEMLAEQLKSKQQKLEEARKQIEQYKRKQMEQGNRILQEKNLKILEKQGKLPPYFENISKDITLHRKLKILLEKQQMTIGKIGLVPPNDIIFGGRDVEKRHAILQKVQNKVFLKPSSSNTHLYVNGNKVTDTIELMHLDRVIFGWNSVYLFKNKDDKRVDEKIHDRQIDWDFCKDEVQHLVDIDESDSEEGGGCCQIY